MRDEDKLKIVKDYIWSLITRLNFMSDFMELCEDGDAVRNEVQAQLLYHQMNPMLKELHRARLFLKEVKLGYDKCFREIVKEEMMKELECDESKT